MVQYVICQTTSQCASSHRDGQSAASAKVQLQRFFARDKDHADIIWQSPLVVEYLQKATWPLTKAAKTRGRHRSEVTNREEESDDNWDVLHRYEDRVDKLAFEIHFVSKFSKYRDILNTCLGLPGLTEDDVAVKEEEWMWRGLLNETFHALAARHGLKTLEIRSILPKACSTFYTSEWRTLIEGLDDLDIELWGGHGGYHASDFGYKGGLGVLRSTTTDGYLDFVERTNDFFFAHCKSATRLRLAADVNTPIGMAGEKPHVAIPLKPEDLPKLTHFELENCVLDPALGRYINAHSQKLRSLGLTNCHTRLLRSRRKEAYWLC
ncbi:uncharacterized protein MYCGRDRAFT_91236 [Zymoseptoria tritici IPO323]|uniref:Uncharacterized protein n=1 Tax=Zymoseptoria tritici (strain CBS 115943 / IPO323) TaxID=336722 RepID=F9X4U3_ZYMTI|nr:uncharacterized protein MYCGRDRAFT_91236 [Zymoseptoria tritici IPO323]EGP90239.1 hypothetical protein MYCGRDRAFT_91236 [Zymoseptoria tritici IPO323]